MRLLNDGHEVTLKEWAYEIINEMIIMCDVLEIDGFDTLNLMLNRILNPDFTYGKMLLSLIKQYGYINAHIILSKNNKQTSIDNLKSCDVDGCGEVKKYFDVALAGK